MNKTKNKFLLTKNKYAPIVFMNTPINSKNDDIIGMTSAVDSIENAIQHGAQLIGVIANYGAGKSSLTEMLSKKRKNQKKPIYINMWDTISRIEQSNLTNSKEPTHEETIGLLTKAFVYQLASGIDTKTANLVNRYLNKNYGILSFSINSPFFWLFGITALLSFMLSKLSELFSISEILHFITPLEQFISLDMLFDISLFLNNSSPFFLCLAILFGVIGLKSSTIAYSHFKEQKERTPDVNDIFEAYSIVFRKLSKFKIKRRLIIVEDLDRIKNKSLVIGFLKEIYRFNSLNQKSKKRNPVFIIAINSESNLETTDTTDTTEFFYSKLFDYTVSLKPIHFSDYAEIVLGIIGTENSKSRKKLNKVLEKNDKIKNNTLPSSFNWLITGHNLTIRQIKERLNSAVALLVTLKNKGYANQSFVRFSSCAAVTYLEHQYPECFNILLELEEAFSELINKVINLKQTHSGKLEEAIKNSSELLVLFENQKFKKQKNLSNFQEDVIKMLCNSDITDDFRMYFYSFPKSTYIMNSDERMICNYILQPASNYNYNDLNETIYRIILLNEGSKIIETIGKLANDDNIKQFPEVVLRNENLFLWTLDKEDNKLFKTLCENINWLPTNYALSLELFKLVFSFCIKNSKTNILLKYSDWLASVFAKFDENHKVTLRKDLFDVTGDKYYIKYFKNLYYGNETTTSESELSGYSLITETELSHIHNCDTVIALINIKNITTNNFLPISSYLSQKIRDKKSLKKAEECYIKITQLTKPQNLSNDLLKFLTENCVVNHELFSYVLKDDNKTTERYLQISNYIDSLKEQDVPCEMFQLLEQHIIDEGLTTFIIDSLKKLGLYTSLLAYCSKTGSLPLVDFFDKTQQNSIIQSIKTLFIYDINVFEKIRLYVTHFLAKPQISEEEKNISDFLYYEDTFPIITVDELQTFDDICEALKYLNRTKINEDNYDYIINFFNEHINRKNIVTATKLLLSNDYNDKYKTKSIPANIINNINFSKVNFSNLSSSEQQEIIDYIGCYIDLNNYENVYSLLFQTESLIPSLESVLSNKQPSKYIEVIQKIDKPSEYTIKWLKESAEYISLPPNTQKAMLSEKAYKKYIIGKILNDKYFVFPVSCVPNEFIFSEYTPTSPIWEYIRNNTDLINKIIEEKAYTNFSSSQFATLLPLLFRGTQTYDSVKFILDNLPNQALSFLQIIGKIKSSEDSIQISNLLVQTPYIQYLKDDAIFNTVKERLWEDIQGHSGYKGLFTKRRNDYFKNNN